jgi:glyoxylase-like metal-dependent hydrolase (beta-lactamase superfamily II)
MPKIGPYEVHAVETGVLRLDGGAMFGIVPKPLWARRVEPDEKNRIPLAMRCLLLVGEGRVVLVDAGVGHKYDAKFGAIYGIDHESDTLASSLARHDITPGDVTDLVLTHLHFDHVGGATVREGGVLRPTFENARHYVQRDHWAWSQSGHVREQASFLDENLLPLAERSDLAFLEGDGPVASELPGVSVRCVHGHTNAQQLVLVEGEARSLLYAADLMPTSAHLAPAWNMGYDIRPLDTIEEKAALLDEAAAEGWTLFFEHDPAVEIGEVERTERGPRLRDARHFADL